MIDKMLSRKFLLTLFLVVALFRANHPELAAAVGALWLALEAWLDHHTLSAEVTAFAIRHGAEMQDLAPAIGFAFGDGPEAEYEEAASTVPMGFAYPRTANREVNR